MTRRPISALLVAGLACVATATVLAWGTPPAVETPVAAAVSTATASHGQGASGAPSPTAEPVGPAATMTPAATPRASEPGSLRDGLAAALQVRLDGIRKKYAIPGLSVTIILADGTTWTGVSGHAVVKGKVKVEPDTAFAIASISKTYTAALVLALADEGALDLDARVTTFLPKVKIAGKATVRQLLDHTSGLPDFFLNGKIDRALYADRGRTWTTADTFRYVGKPIFPAGKGWYYSNTNYYLLGMIAEAVDGRPLAEQVRVRFLDPLGLDHTYTQVAESPRSTLAHGYRVSGTAAKPKYSDLTDGSEVVPFTSVVTAAGGAGSLAASSIDVARWARALYGGEVLSEATVAAMVADGKLTARFKPRIPYGLGVQLVKLDGRPALGHSGRLTGFRSVVRHLPAEGITIAVLTNQSKQDPAIIAKALVRIVSPPKPAPTTTPASSPIPPTPPAP